MTIPLQFASFYETLPYIEQRALNFVYVRVLLVCECRRWQRVPVALPALAPGTDFCRRILNRRQCAIGLKLNGR